MSENRSDDAEIEPMSAVAKEVMETITGKQHDAPGEHSPAEEARKGDEPVDNLE